MIYTIWWKWNHYSIVLSNNFSYNITVEKKKEILKTKQKRKWKGKEEKEGEGEEGREKKPGIFVIIDMEMCQW